ATGKPRLLEALLELDCRAEGLPGGYEHGESLVSPQLEEDSPMRLYGLAHQLGERRGQSGRGVIPVLSGVLCVAADVGDQEGPNLGILSRTVACSDLCLVPRAVRRIVCDGPHPPILTVRAERGQGKTVAMPGSRKMVRGAPASFRVPVRATGGFCQQRPWELQLTDGQGLDLIAG